MRITDVQPASGSGSLVRFIEIYRACGTYHVRSDDYVFKNTSVQKLAGKADVCASEDTLNRQVDNAKRKKVEEWPDQYAIAARCGSETVLHHLPWLQDLKFYVLEERAPRLAALWALPNTIPLGRGQPLVVNADPAQAALEKHRLAEQAAIDIRNGHFDLAAPSLAPSWQAEGKYRISEIVPDFTEATAPEEDFGVVENLDHLGVEKYETIHYPQMAKIAHIQGDVTLEISIDPATGSTTAVNVLSGHPILKNSVTDAVTKWVFLHPYYSANPLRVTVHFALIHCPPTVETTSTAAASTQKKPTKKRKQ